MKRSLLVRIVWSGASVIVFVVMSGWYFVPYFYRWSQSATEQEAIDYIQHEIMSFKSLNFSPSSELISILASYECELENIHKERDISWTVSPLNFDDVQKRDELITVNKKILQGYVQDLQTYTKDGMATTSSLVQFSYDKVVRLTIALAELERNRNDGLPADEYIKKIDRMHEIITQSIIHSKKTLRSYLQAGLKEENTKVQVERERVTRKVEHLIDLDKILYL